MTIRTYDGSSRRMRWTAVAGLTVAVLAATSGCSYFTGSTSSPDAISFITIDAGSDNVQLGAIIKAFEKQSAKDGDGADHKGYKVDLTYIPEDSYTAKFQTAMLADPPDVASVADIFSFQPLDKTVYGANNIPISGFSQALTSACGLDGKVYCVGTNVGNMVLFYNKAMFDKAGIAYPSGTTPMNFQQYTSLAHKLTQKGADGKTSVWGTGNVGVISWLDPDVLLDSTGRKVEATGSDFATTVKTLSDSAQAGDMPTDDQADALGGGDGVDAMFLDGKLAMVPSDNYLIAQADKAGVDYGLAPLPVPTGYKPWVVTWTNSYGIPNGAKHTAAAAKLLAFMATKGQEIQATYGYMPLATKQANEWANTDIRKQLVAIASLARPTVPQPNEGEWQTSLEDAVDAAARSGSQALPLLTQAQPKAQQALNSAWKKFDESMAARKK